MNLADAWSARVASIEAEALPTLSPDELLMLAGMELERLSPRPRHSDEEGS